MQRPIYTKAIYPCKDCEDRKPGCHGSCEKYLAARAEDKAKAAEVIEKAKPDNVYLGYHNKQIKTWRNRRYR